MDTADLIRRLDQLDRENQCLAKEVAAMRRSSVVTGRRDRPGVAHVAQYCLAGAVIGALACGLQSLRPDRDSMSLKRLQIVDAEGQPRVILGVTDDGESFVQLIDGLGVERAAMTVGPAVGSVTPRLQLCNGQGIPVILLEAQDDHHGGHSLMLLGGRDEDGTWVNDVGLFSGSGRSSLHVDGESSEFTIETHFQRGLSVEAKDFGFDPPENADPISRIGLGRSGQLALEAGVLDLFIQHAGGGLLLAIDGEGNPRLSATDAAGKDVTPGR